MGLLGRTAVRTAGGGGSGTSESSIGEDCLSEQNLYSQDFQSSYRIGFDHPRIVVNTYCPYCSFFDCCVSDSFAVCERPGLVVLLHRLCRGRLVKARLPFTWRCQLCGEIVNQRR